jgi:L-lactate dehydrogenase
MKTRKVAIVGAGAVGSTFAYALALDGCAEEIVLIDKQEELAEGQVLDLAHGLPFLPPVEIRMGDVSDYADAQLIVITAGTSQKKGETRLDLQQRNAQIMTSIMDDITEQEAEAVILVVANPVDVLTRVALERSRWPRTRIFGSGTVLDTSRFRFLLSKHCNVSSKNVHGLVLGEHGDSEIIPWSLTHIAGIRMDKYCAICGDCTDWDAVRSDIAEAVRHSAYHIIDYKGATNFAIGLALVRITRAILRNEHAVLTVSVQLRGEYELNDVCLSVPCLVSAKGIERVIVDSLQPRELEALQASADVLNEAWIALNESRYALHDHVTEQMEEEEE